MFCVSCLFWGFFVVVVVLNDLNSTVALDLARGPEIHRTLAGSGLPLREESEGVRGACGIHRCHQRQRFRIQQVGRSEHIRRVSSRSTGCPQRGTGSSVWSPLSFLSQALQNASAVGARKEGAGQLNTVVLVTRGIRRSTWRKNI